MLYAPLVPSCLDQGGFHCSPCNICYMHPWSQAAWIREGSIIVQAISVLCSHLVPSCLDGSTVVHAISVLYTPLVPSCLDKGGFHCVPDYTILVWDPRLIPVLRRKAKDPNKIWGKGCDPNIIRIGGVSLF